MYHEWEAGCGYEIYFGCEYGSVYITMERSEQHIKEYQETYDTREQGDVSSTAFNFDFEIQEQTRSS